jgi:hypothetical protein
MSANMAAMPQIWAMEIRRNLTGTDTTPDHN